MKASDVDQPLRLLYIGISPIQNTRPYRLMRANRDVHQTVLYLRPSMAAANSAELVNQAAFDTGDDTGYSIRMAKPSARARPSGPLLGLSADPWKLAAQNEVIVIYGHSLLSFWLAMISAKIRGKHLVLTTDATYAEGTAETKKWKAKLKPMFLRFLYNWWVDAVFVPSTASKRFLEQTGIDPQRIVVTPYVVDEDLFLKASSEADVPALRRDLGIPQDHVVFLFCAKFLQRKRPADAIRAFASLKTDRAFLVMIGTGPLEEELHRLAQELGVAQQVRFTGLVKYSRLPDYYTLSDVLVFCSDHEPYGLPVNESMLCGKPVIVSDRIGARLDLVEEGITGWTYPAGDVGALARLMVQAIADPEALRRMGRQAREKMKTWSSEVNVENQLAYFRKKGWM